MCPFRGARITNEQQEFNRSMSKVRIAVEWIFGDIINYFKFLDFKKNPQNWTCAVGKMYLVCALLHNARACLYKNSASNFFYVNNLDSWKLFPFPGLDCIQFSENLKRKFFSLLFSTK